MINTFDSKTNNIFFIKNLFYRIVCSDFEIKYNIYELWGSDWTYGSYGKVWVCYNKKQKEQNIQYLDKMSILHKIISIKKEEIKNIIEEAGTKTVIEQNKIKVPYIAHGIYPRYEKCVFIFKNKHPEIVY